MIVYIRTLNGSDMKQILFTLFFFTSFFSKSQDDYLKMKDTICPSLCGIRDSSEVARIYNVLLNLDTTKITSGMANYYEDLSHVQYDLCLYNNEDSTYMRMSLHSTEKSLYHNPNSINMLWNAAFGYSVFFECEKVSYYLMRFKKALPKKYLKEYKDQIAIILKEKCPNEELKKEFRIKEEQALKTDQ